MLGGEALLDLSLSARIRAKEALSGMMYHVTV
jgi:hypothetical protein